jgi:hypothetical protein
MYNINISTQVKLQSLSLDRFFNIDFQILIKTFWGFSHFVSLVGTASPHHIIKLKTNNIIIMIIIIRNHPSSKKYAMEFYKIINRII